MYISYAQDDEFNKLAHSCFYRHFLPTVEMRTPEEVKRNILLRSVEGRARSGHQPFRRKSSNSRDKEYRPIRFPNATAYDVAEACNLNPEKEALFSQKKIDEVITFFRKLVNGEKVTQYVNEKGKPFFGIMGFHPELEIQQKDIPSILVGAYLTGCMDSVQYRKQVQKIFGLNMGYGVNYRVDRQKVIHNGSNLEELAKMEHNESDLHRFRQQGIIMDDGLISKEHTNAYIRMEAGCGSLDDIVKIVSGLKYGEHAYYGAVLVDAADTWDKYTANIIAGGYDEMIMNLIKDNESRIQKSYPEFKLPSDEDIAKIVYLTAKAHYPVSLRKEYSKLFAHCSFRYEHQIDSSTKKTIFEMHLAYTQHEIPYQITFSHPSLKLNNKMLYRAFERFIEKNPNLYF